MAVISSTRTVRMYGIMSITWEARERFRPKMEIVTPWNFRAMPFRIPNR